MGLIDLQVNGYGGVDFNQDNLSPDDLHRACATLEADGVERILATVITEALPTMAARLRRLAELRERDPLAQRVIAGLHIEGPFISPVNGYRGAHPIDAVRPASVDAVQMLLDAGGGLVRLVTLAPEHDPGLATTRYLVDAGIAVAAGHTDAPLDVLTTAVDSGLSLFTHLGNGCPATMPRHDNIVQRALSLSDRLTPCFIADGTHVPFFALRNYLHTAGVDRCIVVSDAIAPAGLGPGRYTLSRWELEISDDLVARSVEGNHLVGSALGLRRGAQNLRDHLGLDDATVKRLTETNPAAVLDGR